jgi:aspartyl/asparaginyl-tRNA synthetase
VHVSQLSAKNEGQDVWLRTRVHNTRAKGNNCFLVLRSAGKKKQLSKIHVQVHLPHRGTSPIHVYIYNYTYAYTCIIGEKQCIYHIEALFR